MSSWLASFLFSQQPEDEHAGSSSYGQPYSPRRSPSRGRASTRSGHAHAPSLSPEVSPTSGRKRERGWLPHSASSDQVPRASDVALSPTRAEGAFDTPRSYYAQAAAGSSSMRDDDHTGWTPPEVDADGDEEMPPNKKRKGLAGTVLSTALDAAIFTTALGYTAYQLWRDPPSIGNEDVDSVLKARSRSGRNSTGGAEAPPPYAEHAQSAKPRATPPPSQIPRRVRHAHQSLRPPVSQRKSFAPLSDDGSAFEPYALAIPPTEPDHDAFESARFPPDPLPEFHPFRKFSGVPPPGAMDDDDDDDAEMQAVADRMKALIESGRSALMSTPMAWETASGVDEEGERPMPLPVVAPSRTSTSQHQRRQSASAAVLPSTSFAGGKNGDSFGRRSLGGALDSVRLGHQPRSSRGGSLGGLGDVRLLGKEKTRVPPLGKEKGKAQVLEGVLERTSQYAAKGWWET